MQTLQHICGKLVNAQRWEVRGEKILDVTDPITGAQLETCAECGEGFSEASLFPLDIFPEVFAEMAEALIPEEA